MGLISAGEVGGLGQGLEAAVRVVERVARECASTAMVLSMHYCGANVIEKHGPFEINGSARIMTLLDDLLASFVDQQRMKIAAGSYRPCYRVLS